MYRYSKASTVQQDGSMMYQVCTYTKQFIQSIVIYRTSILCSVQWHFLKFRDNLDIAHLLFDVYVQKVLMKTCHHVITSSMKIENGSAAPEWQPHYSPSLDDLLRPAAHASHSSGFFLPLISFSPKDLIKHTGRSLWHPAPST